MGSSQSQASQIALAANKNLATSYYDIAIPALSQRNEAINQSLAQGEPQYLKDAYQGQRVGLSEGLAAQGGSAQAQLQARSKQATSGGNAFASLNPAQVGAQLANALYGSKFQEGQANINQMFNLTSMGLGGAGTAGNAALTASGNQLQAIGMLPNYNPTYAGIAGGAAGLSSIYGAYNQYNTNQAWQSFLQGAAPQTGYTGNPATGLGV